MRYIFDRLKHLGSGSATPGSVPTERAIYVSRGAKSARRLDSRIASAAIGFVGIAVAIIGLTVDGLRSDAITNASVNIGNIATVLAEQTNRSVQSVDLVLTDIRDNVKVQGSRTPEEFRDLLAGKATFSYLVDFLKRLPEADVISVLDESGRIINLSRTWPAPAVNMSDREFFKFFRESESEGLYISEPVVSRLSGRPVLFFGRRISSPDGSFLGVVLVGLEPNYLRDIYESVTSVPGQSFELRGTNGRILVQYPPTQDQAATTGSRLVADRAVGLFPLTVRVAISETSALAGWKSRALFIALGTVLVLAFLIFVLFVLHRQSQELTETNARMDLAFNNMSQGLCFFDGKQRLIVCNERYLDLYGVSPNRVRPGTTLREIVDLRFQAGSFPKMTKAEYLSWRDSISVSDRPSDTIVELQNGKIYKIGHRPMPGGGWVSTHEDVTESRSNEDRLAYLAHHDVLTGLANRPLFKTEIERAISEIGHKQGPIAILMLDLDRFKKVNDSLGHSAGDNLLQQVANRLRALVKDGDVISRVGGDEFALIQNCPHFKDEVAPREGSIALARQIIDAINQPFEIHNQKVFIGTSIGISLAPHDGADAEDLLNKADIALYASKASGRNGYRFFEPEMMAAVNEHNKLEADMRLGLQRGEFELYYQVFAEVSTRKITGVEALVRWRHPEYGLLSPLRFIPIAESTGLIVPLGEWILRRACQDAMSLPESVTVAVNLSSVQFRTRNLFDVVMSALNSSGLPARRLELEITESVLLEQETDYVAQLRQLKNAGISIALDDFGTGYSSLSYLKQFPFDKIKIDRTFTRDIARVGESMAIVSAVIGLARGLEMVTTAEGIETEEQFEIIRAGGVTLAQGFLFGKPSLISEIRISEDVRANKEMV
jgi:diguanylate cyclase (GGDEF)-like protein